MSKPKDKPGQVEDNLLRADLDLEVESDDNSSRADVVDEDGGARSSGRGGGSQQPQHKPRSRPKPPTAVGEVKRRKTAEEEDDDENSNVAGPSRPQGAPRTSGAGADGEMDWTDGSSDSSEEDESEQVKTTAEIAASSASSTNLRQRKQVSATTEAAGGRGSNVDTDGVFEEAIEKLAEATRRYQRSVEEEIQTSSPSTSRPQHGGRLLEGVHEYFRNPTFEASEDDENGGGGRQGGIEWAMPGNQPVAATVGQFPTEVEAKSPDRSVAAAAAEEQERQVWARKMFRRTFDHVFPGFAQGAAFNNVKMDYECPLMRPASFRCSAPLQALLRAEAMFFFLWVVSFVYTYDIRIGVLKELHGNLVLCMAALFSVINIPRILIGLKSSVNEKLEMLALFWMMTFVVQLPLFGFILFTDLFTSVKLPFTIIMDAVTMVFIVLELTASTVHLKRMVSGELTIIELARKSMETNKGKPKKKSRTKAAKTEEEGVVGSVQEEMNRSVGDSSGTSSSSDDSDDESIEYSMEIRRLPPRGNNTEDSAEQPERDDSNQVSSTSDSLRQRPIQVL